MSCGPGEEVCAMVHPAADDSYIAYCPRHAAVDELVAEARKERRLCRAAHDRERELAILCDELVVALKAYYDYDQRMSEGTTHWDGCDKEAHPWCARAKQARAALKRAGKEAG